MQCLNRYLYRFLTILGVICFFGPSSRVFGEDTSDPILDLMLEKGMITEAEAAKVKAEAEAIRTNEISKLPQSKWNISDGIKNVELFGDIRLRYEDRSAEDPKGGSIDLQRLRYAVRLGLRGNLFDDFYYGLRLDTSPNPRSSFATLGASSASSSVYQAPFGKSNGGISIGQVYLGWRPWEWVDLTVGKMSNPLYTSSLVWNGNITPEGFAEHFKYTVGPADLFTTFGQFLYVDTNPVDYSNGYFNPLNVSSSGLPFLLAWQGGMNYHITKRVSLKVAPVLYQYTEFNNGKAPLTTGGVGPDFDGTFVGQGEIQGVNGAPAYYNLANGTPGFDGFYANQTGINNLLVLEFPLELNVKLDNFDLRLFGDYAQNLQGSKRATAAYDAAHSSYFSTGPGQGLIQQISSPQTSDTKAYQIGFDLGSHDSLGLVSGTASHRHGWEIKTYWQHIEQYSLDPNLLDTDFFEGVENMQGIYVALGYGLTDNLTGAFRYGNAWRINDKLGTGGSGQDISQMNPVNHYQIFQVDLTLKF